MIIKQTQHVALHQTSFDRFWAIMDEGMPDYIWCARYSAKLWYLGRYTGYIRIGLVSSQFAEEGQPWEAKVLEYDQKDFDITPEDVRRMLDEGATFEDIFSMLVI